MKYKILSVALLMALGFSIQSQAGMIDEVNQPQVSGNNKSLSEVFESFKSDKKVANKDSIAKMSEVDNAVVEKKSSGIPETEYDEINALQNKLEMAEDYIADGRPYLDRYTCKSASTCKQYYTELQIESNWLDATKRGYAKLGCAPNKSIALASDEESIYYVSKDPMLAKDELRLIKISGLKKPLTDNKRLLSSRDYDSKLCSDYAKDAWKSLHKNEGVKTLKIKKAEY